MTKKISLENGNYIFYISKEGFLKEECYEKGEFQWEDIYADNALIVLFNHCLELREALEETIKFGIPSRKTEKLVESFKESQNEQ